MKKFIIKSCFFIIPFFALYVINITYFDQNEGDLTRMGFLYFNPTPKESIENQFSLTKKYTLVSELNNTSNSKFDVMTIGDSFSEQDSLGYKNYLAHQDVSVLHIDRDISGPNPTQRLIELLNGDFFDSIKVKYVVLQSIERDFISRCIDLDFNKEIQIDSIKNIIVNNNAKPLTANLDLFSDALFIIPLTNIRYQYSNKPKYSQSFKVLSNKSNLFSNDPNEILFYENDVFTLKDKNNPSLLKSTNDIMNRINTLLLKKNIKLIVLISPDKYDLYYEYILNKQNFEKPLFFTYYSNLPKQYKYVQAMDVLSKAVSNRKDIYYYDDTHWSPIGAKIIANEILKVINEK